MIINTHVQHRFPPFLKTFSEISFFFFFRIIKKYLDDIIHPIKQCYSVRLETFFHTVTILPLYLVKNIKNQLKKP